MTLVACQSKTEIEKEVLPPLSKQEALELLYKTKVIPLFKAYDKVEIPTDFVVDKKDASINAGASFGYVEVSQGLIDSDKEVVQLFVLAHEVAHIATISQATIFNLGDEIPAGEVVNPYQKAELLADLMAIHLMATQEAADRVRLEKELNYLTSLFGMGGFTHPSGTKRVAMMREYLKLAALTKPKEAFYFYFEQIWTLESF